MPQIPDKSVDLVLTDLSYGITACKWDTPIDLAEMETIKPCVRNVLQWYLLLQPFASALIMSNPRNFKYEWIWEKPQGTNPLNAKIMPLKNHEMFVYFIVKLPHTMLR